MRMLCVCVRRTLKWSISIKFIDYINYVVQQQEVAKEKKTHQMKNGCKILIGKESSGKRKKSINFHFPTRRLSSFFGFFVSFGFFATLFVARIDEQNDIFRGDSFS